VENTNCRGLWKLRGAGVSGKHGVLATQGKKKCLKYVKGIVALFLNVTGTIKSLLLQKRNNSIENQERYNGYIEKCQRKYIMVAN